MAPPPFVLNERVAGESSTTTDAVGLPCNISPAQGLDGTHVRLHAPAGSGRGYGHHGCSAAASPANRSFGVAQQTSQRHRMGDVAGRIHDPSGD